MINIAFGLLVIALVTTGALAYQAEEQKPNPGMGGMTQGMTGEQKQGEQSHQSMQGMMGMMMKMMEQCSAIMTSKSGETKQTPNK
jgi:hypothetical protein